MATTTVRLNKGDSPAWGFRLQGGKDFGTPLVIQKVNGGSPAERAGLVAGDAVVRINNTDVYNLLHKEAQDVIVRAGNSFDITIQRGGSTWKPSVVPVGSLKPSSPASNSPRPVTKTSLAARPAENIGAIGTGHNLSAKPFSPQLNGAVNGGPKLVNKQYNSPLKLYSEDAIAETLSAQTEVLSTGALGVNFKKNEKNYDATNSAVYRMLQEAENDTRSPTTEVNSNAVNTEFYSHHSHAIGGRKTVTPRPTTPGERPGDTSRRGEAQEEARPPAEGATVCSDCERVIVGVFVRIKDKNLHVECFKCATCGSSLKNVGYYNINNKLYCDVHAKAAARSNPAALGGSPYTPAPPGAPANAISQALQTHSLAAPLSPKANSLASPYQQDEPASADVPPPPLPLQTVSSESNSNKITNNNLYSSPAPVPFSKYLNKSAPSYSTAPKPFSSVSGPLSPGGTLPRAAPLSPVSTLPRTPLSPAAAPALAPAPSFSSYSPASSAGRSTSNIVWPPPQEEPDIPTACPLFYPPPSQVEASILSKRERARTESENFEENLEVEEITAMAGYTPYYSEELSFSGRKSATECVEILSETLETQKLVESIVKQRPQDPPPLNVDVDLPDNQPTCRLPVCQRKDSGELKRPIQFSPNTVECQLPSKVDNVVPQKWESPMIQAIRTTAPDEDTFAQIPTKRSASALASALSTAPDKPFSPVPPTSMQPVPLPEMTEPYFPPERPVVSEKKPEDAPIRKVEQPKPESPFLQALKVAPDRPFTPVGGTASPVPIRKKPKDPTDKYFSDLPKPTEKLDMRAALTTAPDRPYSPLIAESAGASKAAQSNLKGSSNPEVDKSQLSKPLKPDVLPQSFKMNQKAPKPPSYYPPSILYEATQESQSEETKKESQTKQTTITETQTIQPGQTSQVLIQNQARETPTAFAPVFQGFACYYQNRTDNQQFSIEISTTPPIPTPPPKPQTPIAYIATVEQKPSIITRQTVTQEKLEAEKTSKKQEKSREELKITQIPRQAEEVIQVKPVPVSSMLRKPETLPQYQVELQQTAEADLRYMEKMQKVQASHKAQQQHVSFEQQSVVSKEMREEERKIEKERQQQQILIQQRQQAEQKRIEEERRQQQILIQQKQEAEQRRIEEERRQQQILVQQKQEAEQRRIEEERRQQQITIRQRQEAEQRRVEEERRQQQILIQQRQEAEQRRIEEEKRQQQILVQQRQEAEQRRIEEERRQQQILIQQRQESERRRIEEESRQTQILIQQRQQTQQLRIEEDRFQKQQQLSITKPIITLQPGDTNPIRPQNSFQPVIDDKPPNLSFSPRPRPLTPSMINKPPPVLPYYQTNLVAQHQRAPATYLLDPKSPNASRTPTPCPDGRRSPSPFLSKAREERAKSPAAGPPVNPLQSSKPLPTPESSRIEVAKQNISTFIPEYKSKRDLIEHARGMDFYKREEIEQPSQMYSSQMQVSSQSYPMQTQGSSYQSISSSSQMRDARKQAYQQERMDVLDEQKQAMYVSQSGQEMSQTSISQKSHQENLEASRMSQSQSVQKTADGLSQVQRKKTVTEEYEHSHKEQTIEIERNMTSTKQYPFRCVANPDVEVPPMKGHSTNPQPIGFKKQDPIKCCQVSCGGGGVSQPPEGCPKSQPVPQPPSQPVTRPVFAPPNPVQHVSAPCVSRKSANVPKPDAGVGGGRQAGGISVTPKRGRGVLNTAAIGGARIPLCGSCHSHIRGPFITALGKIWCPQHFVCATPSCRRPLQDLGFVEEKGQLYCEYCFEQYLAPPCSKCSAKIKGDCLKAIGKNFHPECFNCSYCGKLFGNSPFFLEDGSPYCDADWNELFTTKCFACGFPVEAGDRWVEALNNNYHSQCFNCTMCKKNLEGQSFFAKGGRPFCKNHAR